jgi:transcriptional regulator with XRE-family HTH domain
MLTRKERDESRDLLAREDARIGDGSATNVQLGSDLESAPGDSLNLFGAEFWNDRAPLGHSRRTDSKRARNVRRRFEVIDGGLLQHEADLTTVKSHPQPQCCIPLLTSVHMEMPPSTLADRLTDAMRVAGLSASDLARKCKVSPAAVTKWLDGRTKRLSADNIASAAKALGVFEAWLRTGKGPRQGEHADDERASERVMELLDEIRQPLAQLVAAIDKLSAVQARSLPRKRTGS